MEDLQLTRRNPTALCTRLCSGYGFARTRRCSAVRPGFRLVIPIDCRKEKPQVLAVDRRGPKFLADRRSLFGQVTAPRGEHELTAKGMSSRLWRLAAVGATAVFTVGMVASPAVALNGAGAAANPGGGAPSSTVQGRTYAQWSAARWQWTLEQPNVPDSPVVDPNPGTATPCPSRLTAPLGSRQGGSGSWPGPPSCQGYSTAYRSCSVRAGAYLFFPVIDALDR